MEFQLLDALDRQSSSIRTFSESSNSGRNSSFSISDTMNKSGILFQSNTSPASNFSRWYSFHKNSRLKNSFRSPLEKKERKVKTPSCLNCFCTTRRQLFAVFLILALLILSIIASLVYSFYTCDLYGCSPRRMYSFVVGRTVVDDHVYITSQGLRKFRNVKKLLNYTKTDFVFGNATFYASPKDWDIDFYMYSSIPNSLGPSICGRLMNNTLGFVSTDYAMASSPRYVSDWMNDNSSEPISSLFFDNLDALPYCCIDYFLISPQLFVQSKDVQARIVCQSGRIGGSWAPYENLPYAFQMGYHMKSRYSYLNPTIVHLSSAAYDSHEDGIIIDSLAMANSSDIPALNKLVRNDLDPLFELSIRKSKNNNRYIVTVPYMFLDFDKIIPYPFIEPHKGGSSTSITLEFSQNNPDVVQVSSRKQTIDFIAKSGCPLNYEKKVKVCFKAKHPSLKIEVRNNDIIWTDKPNPEPMIQIYITPESGFVTPIHLRKIYPEAFVTFNFNTSMIHYMCDVFCIEKRLRQGLPSQKSGSFIQIEHENNLNVSTSYRTGSVLFLLPVKAVQIFTQFAERQVLTVPDVVSRFYKHENVGRYVAVLKRKFLSYSIGDKPPLNNFFSFTLTGTLNSLNFSTSAYFNSYAESLILSGTSEIDPGISDYDRRVTTRDASDIFGFSIPSNSNFTDFLSSAFGVKRKEKKYLKLMDSHVENSNSTIINIKNYLKTQNMLEKMDKILDGFSSREVENIDLFEIGMIISNLQQESLEFFSNFDTFNYTQFASMMEAFSTSSTLVNSALMPTSILNFFQYFTETVVGSLSFPVSVNTNPSDIITLIASVRTEEQNPLNKYDIKRIDTWFDERPSSNETEENPPWNSTEYLMNTMTEALQSNIFTLTSQILKSWRPGFFPHELTSTGIFSSPSTSTEMRLGMEINYYEKYRLQIQSRIRNQWISKLIVGWLNLKSSGKLETPDWSTKTDLMVYNIFISNLEFIADETSLSTKEMEAILILQNILKVANTEDSRVESPDLILELVYHIRQYSSIN
jgi:hypothetical protein